MVDKTFELMEKMYAELLEFKKETNERFDGMDGRLGSMDGRLDKVDSRLGSMDGRLDKVDSRLDSMEGRLDRVEGHLVRIENDHGAKLDVLLDGYKQNAENITEINHKLDKLTDRVENQEIKLQVLRTAK